MSMCDIMHDIKNVCVMILKVLVGTGSTRGWYNDWSTGKKDKRDRLFCVVHNIFPDVHEEGNPLTWRLTRDELNSLDLRVKNFWWPHYYDMLESNNLSFWKFPSACWKSRHKSLIFLVRRTTISHVKI